MPVKLSLISVGFILGEISPYFFPSEISTSCQTVSDIKKDFKVRYQLNVSKNTKAS